MVGLPGPMLSVLAVVAVMASDPGLARAANPGPKHLPITVGRAMMTLPNGAAAAAFTLKQPINDAKGNPPL